MKAENRLHFGVPIVEIEIDEVKARSEALALSLTALRSSDEGVQRSNQRGWHSSDDLFNHSADEIRWLSEMIYQVAGKLIRHADQMPEDAELLLSSMWANINDAGAWNAPHVHLPCEWSGVVYIDVPETHPEPVNGIRDGDILFLDPVPVGAPYRPATTISYTPKIGTMYVFPSYLMHMVAPHYNEKPRISVAFNFRVASNVQQFAR